MSLLEAADSPASRASIADAFRHEAAGLLGFFIRREVDVDDAADLVSETFLAAWKSHKTSTVEPELLRAWLFGIARKVLSRYRRGRVRRSALSDRLRATLSGDQAVQMTMSDEEAELAHHVRALLGFLPEIDQEIVRLVYWDGFSQEEVALIIGRSATAVRTRLSRTRKILRDQLAESGDVA
ncbi:RNA polymerase sigma factor [Microbacterium aurantiacum]|uniref:RNA polymerase sigma factor n=2 Tax=Microbacterium aurantiacum TaxID=162393 RepID=UPI0040383EDC